MEQLKFVLFVFFTKRQQKKPSSLTSRTAIAWKNEKPEESVAVKEPPHPTIISAVPYDKPIPGSTLRRLDDPDFDVSASSTPVPATKAAGPAATDDLNEARDRFDRFWGCNQDKDEVKY